MQRAVQIFYRWFVKPALQIYLRRDRKARYDGFRLLVKKNVFHPLLYFSTRFLYDFIREKNLAGREFLELGCGTGLLSLLAQRKDAKVTAVDVDPRAVQNAESNFRENFGTGQWRIVQSDLFESLGNLRFDLIVINPPYYFKQVTHPGQQAWYCGAEGEYFHKLFRQLGTHVNPGAEIYMSLEEGCDIGRIKGIATSEGVSLTVVKEKKIRWEKNLIYSVVVRPLQPAG